MLSLNFISKKCFFRSTSLNASGSIWFSWLSLRSNRFRPLTCMNACDFIVCNCPRVIFKSSNSSPNSKKSSGDKFLVDSLVRDKDRRFRILSVGNRGTPLHSMNFLFNWRDCTYLLSSWRLVTGFWSPLMSNFSKVYWNPLNASAEFNVFIRLSFKLRTLQRKEYR